jgi:uncharacterized protein YjcR
VATRKLTKEEVKEILSYNKLRIHHKGMADVYSIKNIASKFNVSPTTVHGIIYGYHYNDVAMEVYREDNL